MAFAERAAKHDQVGVPAVQKDWARYGFVSVRAGNEMDNPAVRSFLAGQHDRMAMMLRYRPDTIMGLPPSRTLLVEVKTTTYPNSWAIEFDAWRALYYWNQHCPTAVLAFVDPTGQPSGYCFSKDAVPTHVRVPRRQGWKEWRDRVAPEFPFVNFESMDWASGSGTAFFLFRSVGPGKVAAPLDTFIRQVIPAEELREAV